MSASILSTLVRSCPVLRRSSSSASHLLRMMLLINRRDRSLQVMNSFSPPICLVTKDRTRNRSAGQDGGSCQLGIGGPRPTLEPRRHVPKHTSFARFLAWLFSSSVVCFSSRAGISTVTGESSYIVRVESIVKVGIVGCVPPLGAGGSHAERADTYRHKRGQIGLL